MGEPRRLNNMQPTPGLAAIGNQLTSQLNGPPAPSGALPATQPVSLPQTDQLDPSIVALMHGIKTSEGTNGDYNAIGDEGTAAGIGQWSNESNGVPQKLQQGQIPANFQGEARQYGLNPNDFSPANQNQVMYASIAADKQAGLSPEQILSKWNSGSPNAYLTNPVEGSSVSATGTSDVAAYVQRGMAAAQEYAQANNQSAAPQQSGIGVPTADAATTQAQPAQPESTLQKAGDVAGAVGNFLFPAVKDVYNDVTGQNTGANQKTYLQQLGDVALTALPFIPGLGEAGEVARGAELATEGAADAAPGLLSKLAGSSVAKGAGVGYGAGVASNLSQGQGLGQAFLPNANTILGAATGGVIPAAIEGASGLLDRASGITPQIKNMLGDVGDTAQYDKYINASKGFAQNARNASALDVANDDVGSAAKVINQHIQTAGAEKAAALEEAANTKLPDMSPVADDFASTVAKKYGIQLGVDEDGKVVSSIQPGRVSKLLPSDQARIEDAYQKLLALKGGTVQTGQDVIDALDNNINYNKAKNAVGTNFDPIEGLISKTRKSVDSVTRELSPRLAAANDRYSQLSKLAEETNKLAGNRLQRGSLLMKRVFSGDMGKEGKALFSKIKGETGIDLINSATLAKHAIDTVGNSTEKSLLSQAIEGGVAAHTGGIVPAIFNGGKAILQHTIANPETRGRALVQAAGAKGKGLVKSLLTKGGIEASQAVKPALNSLGINL